MAVLILGEKALYKHIPSEPIVAYWELYEWAQIAVRGGLA
jgi:hypothetical protein